MLREKVAVIWPPSGECRRRFFVVLDDDDWTENGEPTVGKAILHAEQNGCEKVLEKVLEGVGHQVSRKVK